MNSIYLALNNFQNSVLSSWMASEVHNSLYFVTHQLITDGSAVSSAFEVEGFVQFSFCVIYQFTLHIYVQCTFCLYLFMLYNTSIQYLCISVAFQDLLLEWCSLFPNSAQMLSIGAGLNFLIDSIDEISIEESAPCKNYNYY